MASTHRRAAGATLLAVSLTLTGCAAHIPTDPHRTLERVEDGVLRVGVTENAPWVELARGGGAPTGTEPDLVTDFAAGLDAEVAWTTGSEAVLATALERGELDLIIGGFLADTPWVEQAAATRPYTTSVSAEGEQQHVMLVRMGENRFLMALDAFLFERGAS